MIHTKTYSDYDFILDYLYAGTWVIQSNDSVPHTFQLTGETPERILQYIKDAVQLKNQDIETQLNSALNSNHDLTIPELVYTYMPKQYDASLLDQKEIYKTWIDLLWAAIEYYNNISCISNPEYQDIRLFNSYSSSYIDNFINGSVVIYEAGGGPMTTAYVQNDSDTLQIPPLEDKKLYIVNIYQADRLIQRNYLYKMQCEDYIRFFYNDDLASITEKDDIQERLKQTIGLTVIPSDKEEIYITQSKHNPTNMFLPAPNIVYDPVRSEIQISLTNYSLIQTFEQQLYIAAVEEDQLAVNTGIVRRIPITGAKQIMSRTQYIFNDEPYYWYIETEDGTKLSSISYYDTRIDQNEYPELERQQRTTDLITRMSHQLQYDLGVNEARNVVLALDEASRDTDITSSELIHQGIQNYIRDFRNTNIISVISSLYRDKIYHEDTDFSLFGKAVIRKNWHIIDFPTAEAGYIIEVYGYSISQDIYHRTYYHSNTNTSISIRYDTDDYVVFTLFSELGWRIVGFLVFDNTDPNRLKYNQYEFPAEVTGD